MLQSLWMSTLDILLVRSRLSMYYSSGHGTETASYGTVDVRGTYMIADRSDN